MIKSGHRLLVATVAVLIILIGVGGRLVFPPYGNLSGELSEGNFTANELFQEFMDDPTAACLHLVNRVIIIEGVVTAGGDGYIMLGQDMRMVRCVFRKSIYDRKPELEAGTRVTLKGVCRGLNMTEVLVTHCILINKPAN